MGQRNYRLDRAKGALVFLVVLGHMLAAVSPWDSDVLRVLQTAIYSFHIPAFVFLAGITAKSDRLPQRVAFFLVLLATAMPLYYGWMSLIGLNPEFDSLVPYWLTWFLLAMVWWTLSTPLIERFPRALLAISVLAALFGGLIPTYDYELSLSRTLVFWPFFVIGKLYGSQVLSWAGGRTPTQKGGLALAAATPMLLFYLYDPNKIWFYGVRNFDWHDVSVPEGAATRLIVGLSAALTTVAFCTFMSNRAGYLCTVGRNSLAVYLLHGFVIRLLDIPLDDSLDHIASPVMLVACVILAVLTTWLFALPPFNAGLRKYGEGVVRMIFLPFSKLRSVRAPS
ncbi:acyltransferase family protein [Nesterenkonia halotolerans]|uniref:acyltransferase family protein n=1 Tax=Nesterenkonia halotolerans TaxID=225325 RepID=UPI003EE67961